VPTTHPSRTWALNSFTKFQRQNFNDKTSDQHFTGYKALNIPLPWPRYLFFHPVTMVNTARRNEYQDTIEESTSPLSTSSQTAAVSTSIEPSPPLKSSSQQTTSAEPTSDCPWYDFASFDLPQELRGQPSASHPAVTCSSLAGVRAGSAGQITAATTFNQIHQEPTQLSKKDTNAALILYGMGTSPIGSSFKSPVPRHNVLGVGSSGKDPDETEADESDNTPEEATTRTKDDEEELFWGLRELKRQVAGDKWKHYKLVPKDRSGTAYEPEEEQRRRDAGMSQNHIRRQAWILKWLT
jgi:hypothetical protein